MGCKFSILEISDGTTTINLIDERTDFCLSDWNPSVAEPKDGGVWHDSSLADGRQLAMRKFANATETMTLQVRGFTQDDVIKATQELRRLLEKVVAYWTTDWQNEPVWIKALSVNEGNARYAVLYDYRTPSDSYPYCEPFCADICEPGMIDWTLVIERGHWQANEPGTSTCVQVNNLQDYWSATDNTFTILNGVDDSISAQQPAGPVTVDPANAAMGDQAGVDYDLGLRFRSVTVPNGTTVTNAYVIFTAAATTLNNNCNLTIQGELNATPTWFSTIADYNMRARTVANVAWAAVETWTQDLRYVSPNITTIINEIVALGGWVSGGSIVLFFENNASDVNVARVPYVDTGTANTPQLVIYFSDGTMATFGHTETCANEVYFSNKHVKAQLTHAFYYDSTLVIYGANIIGAVPPAANLLPAAPAVGDMVYFGIDTSAPDSGPFSSLVFDIGTAQTDLTTVAWQYYSTAGGGTWVALTVQDNTNNDGAGGGDAFDTTGVNSVHWAVPSTWTTTAINGVTGYWVRANVTAIGAAPATPTQQNRDIYTIVTPFVEIDEAQVAGDIMAAARAVIWNHSGEAATVLYSERIFMGLRSLSRGDDFSAYINISDEQNHDDITVAVSAPDTAFAANVVSPTGRCAYYNPGAIRALAQEAYILIDHPLIVDYTGKYHAFLRCTQSGGAAADVFGQLIVSSYGIGSNARFETNTVYTNAVSTFDVLDFGVIQLPNFIVAGSVPALSQIFILLGTGNAAASLYLHDLILIPVDEMAIEICDNISSASAYSAVLSAGYPGARADVDSVSNPRMPTMATLVSNDTNNHYEYLESINSIPVSLQANVDQRLWFFSQRPATVLTPCLPRKADPEIGQSAQVYSTWRYLSMRGAR